jgi:hypothetical protein
MSKNKSFASFFRYFSVWLNNWSPGGAVARSVAWRESNSVFSVARDRISSGVWRYY